ncbi:unnamed protein product [Ixodes pacificus]
MHCVLLGVARQFLELWLFNVGAPYYIGSPQLLKDIDKRLCHIKPPQCMARLPRSPILRKFWKASELQQWLLYFSLVGVDSILHERYLNHFSLLVRGIFMLLQDEVPTADISDSTDCLVQFVVGVQFLYSEKEMTSNVHLLLHLAKSVVLQGPLWAHSCFTFEANMGRLKSLVTSAKAVPHQVMTRVMMAHRVIHARRLQVLTFGTFSGVEHLRRSPLPFLASQDLWRGLCWDWLRGKFLSRSLALLWNTMEFVSLNVCSTVNSTRGQTKLTAQQ